MATNMPMNESTNEFARFDNVATDIVNTFELLIVQLSARRDALLRELQLMKENYISKETIGLLSLKVNENKIQTKMIANKSYCLTTERIDKQQHITNPGLTQLSLKVNENMKHLQLPLYQH